LFLFTRELGFEKESEYYIENDIIRISKKNFTISNLIKEIRKKKIDILIFQHSNSKDIKILSNLTDIKTIFYQHQSFFFLAL
jgi:ADP-heptose:LPS heptosyltransferase